MNKYPPEHPGGKVRPAFLLFLLVAALLVYFLGACSSEDDPVTFIPRVEIYQVPENVPVAGVKVVVMDRQSLLPVAVPVLSDDQGYCQFPALPAGYYSLVAFGGAHFQVIDLPSGWSQDYQGNGNQSAGLLAPDKTPPITSPPQIKVALYNQSGGLPRIQGQIVDAQTNQPLAAAFVSTSPFLSGYTGGTTVKDDVTLADGRFLVSDIAFFMDPDSGNLVQIEPLLVSCAGYLPRTWLYDPPNGDDNVDISGVVISLEAVADQPTGSLSGRLLLDEVPAAGVEVGLGGHTPDKSGVGQPGWLAVTDAEGLFHFPQLPEGVFFLHAGFRLNDGVVYPNQSGNVGRTVVANQETQTGDLVLLHEIDLYYPPNGWQYLGAQWLEPFQWNLVPGAVMYRVYLDRGLLGETTETTFPIPEELELTPGPHVWGIEAVNTESEIIGVSETHGTFYIIDPAP